MAMPRIKNNLGYSQEELLYFYKEDRRILIKYNCMYMLQFNLKAEKFYFAFSQKADPFKNYTRRGRHEFITLAQWLALKPY